MAEDRVAVVTGASSGIGRATALALARTGVKVALGARRTDRLAETESMIKGEGGEVLSVKVDVSKRQECDALIHHVMERWGRVDILVNNAGLMPLSFLKNLKVDEWDRMIDVNVKGVLYCTAAVLPFMLEMGSGHIVNISSVAGRVVFPAGSVYCATNTRPAFSEGCVKS